MVDDVIWRYAMMIILAGNGVVGDSIRSYYAWSTALWEWACCPMTVKADTPPRVQVLIRMYHVVRWEGDQQR